MFHPWKYRFTKEQKETANWLLSKKEFLPVHIELNKRKEDFNFSFINQRDLINIGVYVDSSSMSSYFIDTLTFGETRDDPGYEILFILDRRTQESSLNFKTLLKLASYGSLSRKALAFDPEETMRINSRASKWVVESDMNMIYSFASSIIDEYTFVLREEMTNMIVMGEKSRDMGLRPSVRSENINQLRALISLPIESSLNAFLTKDEEELKSEMEELEKMIMSREVLTSGIDKYSNQSIINRAKRNAENRLLATHIEDDTEEPLVEEVD